MSHPSARSARDWWFDVVPAGVVVAVGALGTTHIEPEPGDRPVQAAAYAIVAAAGLALLGRRRWPMATLAVVTAALALYTAARYPGGPVYLAGPVALYTVATACRRWVGYGIAFAVAAVLIAVRIVADGDGPSVLDLLFLAWAAVAVLAADAMRGRRESAAAQHDRLRYLEGHREEETRRRLAEDRLRIARDLHDSVAHSLAAINVQSGVAAHVLARQPDRAAEALESIRVASRDVLDELGAMLDVLRDGERAPRQPAPDLSQLDQLVKSSQRAGLAVDVRVDGELDGISSAVGTAAYRIVQEALTNVVRHAGASHASVRITVDPGGGLAAEVLDDGASIRPADDADHRRSGMGLVGIRERAQLTGGRSEVGPLPGGGFRVFVSWSGRR